LLPKSNLSIVSNVKDHSPIYIFFRTEEKDTIALVNKNNSIISTNWILNIDKLLPLRLVIPEVIKLQEGKRTEVAYKNELAENYYFYADSVHKKMEFVPFTKVFYKIEKLRSNFMVFFSKKNEIYVDGFTGSHKELKRFLNSLPNEKLEIIKFGFDKNMTYETYIQNKIFIQSLKIENTVEFIY
jgi:hypothetical protein